MTEEIPRKNFKGCLKLTFIEHGDDVKVKLTAFQDWKHNGTKILKKQRIYHVNVYVRLANDETLLVTSNVMTKIDHRQVADFLKIAWKNAVADINEPIKLFDSYLTLSA